MDHNQPDIIQRRPSQNIGSTAAIVDNSGKTHDVPIGLSLTEDEKPIWQALMSAKQFSDWPAPHLAIAHRIVKMETALRRGQKQLDDWMAQGGDIFHPDSILHDYNKNIMAMSKTQIILLRSIGLTTTSVVAPKHVGNKNKEQRAFDDLMNSGALPGFLARPS